MVKEEKSIDVENKVDTDELVSIMGGKMSEKEKEKKKLFEAEDDESEKKDTDTDEDKDKDKSEETDKDDKGDDEKDDDKEKSKEDEDEKKEDEEDKKDDDDDGDDKGSDKEKAEEVDEKKALENEVQALRKTINEMLIPPKVKKEEDADEEEEEEKEETKLERKGKDYVFITQEVLDEEDFVVDAKFLNEFGNRIANQVKKDSLTSTARIVKSHISETQKFRDLASDFYEENPDLKEKKIKSFVAWRVGVLANEHPDWSYEKLFSNLGEDVRGKLGLRAQAEKIEKDRKKKPAFVKKSKGKSKTGTEEVTSTQKEINEMLPK